MQKLKVTIENLETGVSITCNIIGKVEMPMDSDIVSSGKSIVAVTVQKLEVTGTLIQTVV